MFSLEISGEKLHGADHVFVTPLIGFTLMRQVF
jgi:hypothetical protein